ncbi:MAG: hypothetical protein IKL53_03295 [Lachnospiraceae bacterium]|nr:hypothetical protein [Lachnospiraceae bacterium]
MINKIKAIEILKHDIYLDKRGMTYCHDAVGIEAHEMAIKALEQEQKTGHWIPTYGNVKCSVCGSVKDSRNVGKATHYCDFCGARMESEE